MSNEQYPPLTIVLVNATATNWIMEGTEKNAEPIRLAAPGLLRIPPTSKYKVDLPEGGYKYVQIRHIMGCDTLDPAQQDLLKIVPNVEQDNIWVVSGTLTVMREGSTIQTYDYLKLHEGNITNKQRPPDAEPVFMELIGVEVAARTNNSFDIKADAYAVLRDIRQTTEAGGYQYNEEKLGLMATLFDLNHLDSPEEKFAELYMIAEEKPKLIVDSIMNGKKKLFATIKKAEELAVIGLSEERAYFTESNTVILAYKGRPAKNTQVNKLADFLLTPEGKPFMQQLFVSVDRAGSKSLERVRETENNFSNP
jgi:hypothetical protein